jgi:2-hydroxy-3-keto-5-methylthiopentenyl-1-phosphate phosphatase
MRVPARLTTALRRTAVRLRRPGAIAKTVAMKAMDADMLSSLQTHTPEKLTAMMQKNAVDDAVSSFVELAGHSKLLPVYVSKFISVGAEAAYAASLLAKAAAGVIALLHL